MEKLYKIINMQKELLEILGYNLDLKENEIPLFNGIDIKKNDKIVGSLNILNKNMYYLDKNGYYIGNKTKHTRYSRDKEKNMHTMCHVRIDDGNMYFDCFNGIKNKSVDSNIDNNIVKLSNSAYTLLKTLKEEKEDTSISYSDKNIAFDFMWAKNISYIVIEFCNKSIYFEIKDDEVFFEVTEGEDVVSSMSGQLDEVISKNKELLDKINVLIKKTSKVDLLNNSLKYIEEKNKTKEKNKVYKKD